MILSLFLQYSWHFLYSSPAQPLGPEDLVWKMVCYFSSSKMNLSIGCILCIGIFKAVMSETLCEVGTFHFKLDFKLTIFQSLSYINSPFRCTTRSFGQDI